MNKTVFIVTFNLKTVEEHFRPKSKGHPNDFSDTIGNFYVTFRDFNPLIYVVSLLNICICQNF